MRVCICNFSIVPLRITTEMTVYIIIYIFERIKTVPVFIDIEEKQE